MEQKVRVVKTFPDGTAQVLHIRESACSGDCHKCAGCGAQQEKLLFTAENPLGAKPGEMVILRTGSAPVLKAAAVVYLVPLMLFFGGYALGGALWGGVGFALGVGGTVLYDRLVARREKTVYTITGYPPEIPT